MRTAAWPHVASAAWAGAGTASAAGIVEIVLVVVVVAVIVRVIAVNAAASAAVRETVARAVHAGRGPLPLLRSTQACRN